MRPGLFVSGIAVRDVVISRSVKALPAGGNRIIGGIDIRNDSGVVHEEETKGYCGDSHLVAMRAGYCGIA